MKIRFFNRTEDIRFESKIGLRFSRIDSLALLSMLRNSEISTDRFLLKFEKKKREEEETKISSS